MVYVAHNGNDGSARNEFGRIFHTNRCHQDIFCRLFGLVFKVNPHIRRHKRCVFIINGIVDSLHNPFFEKTLGDFYRRNAEFFGKNLSIDPISLFFVDILFVERHNNGNTKLQKLCSKKQTS